MKRNLVFILLVATIFINACSPQKIICVRSYNESKKQEELLQFKEPNIYYFNLRDSLDTSLNQLYLGGLQHVLKIYAKDKSILASDFSVIKPNSVEMFAFEKYLTDSVYNIKNFYLLKVYSDKRSRIIYQTLVIKRKNFCKYLNFITGLKEKEEIILGTPTNGEIEIKGQSKIQRLIEKSFFLIYNDGVYKYIDIDKK